MMTYRLLGRSGLRVSELALGTMTFGEDWGWGASREESQKIFDAYVARGGNFIDTACNYTNGTSERYVGELVASSRERFVVATKYTLSMRKDDPNGGGNSRKNLFQSVDASLARLGTDYLDLLWLHMWDGTTPIDEVMRGLDDLVRVGKVHYIGFSDTPAWIIARADLLAELRGWSRLAAIQLPYNLVRRDAERELLPMARELDLAVTCWGILAGGVLTGKYNPGAKDAEASATARLDAESIESERLKVAAEVVKIADGIGATPAQVSTAWLLAQRQKAPLIPIIGARTVAQMQDALGSVDVTLDEQTLERLDEVSGIELGFPLDFLASENVRELVHGETYGRFVNHRR